MAKMNLKLMNAYFNSIKVRLEHPLSYLRSLVTEFQFHKGTIRTSRGCEGARWWLEFQFHKGTIRTLV